MITAKFFQEFTKQFSETLPPHFQEFRQEFEKVFYQGLETTFQRLNLVTREEFDVQSALLSRTREKVQQLEQKLAAIESTLTSQGMNGTV
jgi:ubiquinone biosynthesis accessory factor UbiK